MQIRINGEPLDFSIEEEKNLAQIAKSLSRWVHEARSFINEIKLNDRTLSLDEALKSEQILLNEIQTLDISIKGNMEQVEEVIQVLKNYIFRFLEEIQKGKEVFCLKKNEKLEGLMWIIDTLTLLSNNLGIQPQHIFYQNKNLEETLNFLKISMDKLSQFIHDADFFYSYFREGLREKLENILYLIQRMSQMYNHLTGTVSDPEFLNSFLEESEKIQELFQRISDQLQEGKDQDALFTLQKVMYFFEALNIVYSKASVAPETHQEILSLEGEVVELMQQMYESFKAQDIVSVSDIAEYELSEKLEALSGILKEAYQLAS